MDRKRSKQVVTAIVQGLDPDQKRVGPQEIQAGWDCDLSGVGPWRISSGLDRKRSKQVVTAISQGLDPGAYQAGWTAIVSERL